MVQRTCAKLTRLVSKRAKGFVLPVSTFNTRSVNFVFLVPKMTPMYTNQRAVINRLIVHLPRFARIKSYEKWGGSKVDKREEFLSAQFFFLSFKNLLSRLQLIFQSFGDFEHILKLSKVRPLNMVCILTFFISSDKN